MAIDHNLNLTLTTRTLRMAHQPGFCDYRDRHGWPLFDIAERLADRRLRLYAREEGSRPAQSLARRAPHWRDA